MSFLVLVFIISFTLTIMAIIFILLTKNHRRIMKGKKVDGHFTIHHNTWDYHIDSGKDLLKWSFIVFVISGILLIMSEILRNEVS